MSTTSSPRQGNERDSAHRGGPKPRLSERLEVHVLPEQLEELDRLADRDGSSRAEQVRIAIRARLAQSS